MSSVATISVTAYSGQGIRIPCPQEICGQGGGWIEIRGLSWCENLQRESLGIYDEYELDTEGRLLRLLRRYDFLAMTEFDLQHCVVDFELPGDCAENQIAVRKSDFKPGDNWWVKISDTVISWLLEQIDAINLHDIQGQKAFHEAKKKFVN